MSKKITALLVLAASSALVSAQPSPTTKLEVNPFNGKPLSAEQIQRELELAKLRTQLLEEALKQTNIKTQMDNVPLRGAVEAAQSRTAVKKEEGTQADMEESRKAAVAARRDAEREREVRRAREEREERDAQRRKAEEERRARVREQEVAKEPTAPVIPRPSLSSVIDVAGKRSAVLDFSGNTLVASDGDMTPAGPLKIIDGSTVEVNGFRLSVHGSTLGRFVVSDANKAPTSEAVAPKPVIAPAPAAQQAPGATAVPPAPQRTALPPLVLPPGVNVLPSSGSR